MRFFFYVRISFSTDDNVEYVRINIKYYKAATIHTYPVSEFSNPRFRCGIVGN